ncbi:MAG: hypothetical protein Ct9H300mP4_16170 [Gammaproteobacteria bacterium]|nr:MAG: hypothetical protein Ct9H300mP4_16170 [Gammaproteobacteria bacterium]
MIILLIHPEPGLVKIYSFAKFETIKKTKKSHSTKQNVGQSLGCLTNGTPSNHFVSKGMIPINHYNKEHQYCKDKSPA